MLTKRIGLLLRLLPILLVLGMALIYRAKLIAALQGTLHLGWIAVLIFPLFYVWNYLAAAGWRTLITVTNNSPAPSSWRLTIIRIEAQAVNLILPLVGISGEVMKAALLAGTCSNTARNASSVLLDITSSTVAGILFVIFGLGLHGALLPVGRTSMIVLFGLSLIVVVLLCSLPSILSRLASIRRFKRWPVIGRFLEAFLHEPDRLLLAFRSAIVWHVLERLLTSGEIWLIARGLGIGLGMVEALFATAFMIGFSILFFFIPAQAGAAEGGLALAFSVLGLTPMSGLTVALVRRERQLVVCGVGLTILLFRDRHLLLTRPL